MRIQQAVFTSSDRSHMQGYQLVAQSAGIDRHVAKELCRWSPSQLVSDDPAMWTINYYPISEDYVAVARTVLGGPEYSNRGGSQVVTITAVLRNEQFEAYHNNAMLLVQTALALGKLRLPSQLASRNLEEIELPDQPFAGTFENSNSATELPIEMPPHPGSIATDVGDAVADAELLSDMAGLIHQRRRFAILGTDAPTAVVAQLIPKLPQPIRRGFSFTTGLPPAAHRPFQAHFLQQADLRLRQTLKSEGITLRQVVAPAASMC